MSNFDTGWAEEIGTQDTDFSHIDFRRSWKKNIIQNLLSTKSY